MRTCSSTAWKPGEQLAEHVRPERDRERQPDRGVDRVSAADPVPESERVDRVDAEGGDLVERSGDGDEVVGDSIRLRAASDPSIAPADSRPRPQPVAREARVGQRLEGREGLRRDDEERRLGIEVGRRLRQVGRIDVGDEARLDPGIRIRLKGLVDHDGPEVGAADPDVDDVRHLLAGHALPVTRAHPLGEGGHALEHRLHVGIDVLSVDDERRRSARRTPQRRVEDGAVLGRVDVVAREHRGVVLGDPGLLAEAHE